MHSRTLSGPLAAASNACTHNMCMSSCYGHDASACPLLGFPCGSQACLHMSSVRLSWGRHLRSAFCLNLCPGLQCLGLCSHGSVSHICKFEARPAAPSVRKGAMFVAGSAFLTVAVIATMTTQPQPQLRQNYTTTMATTTQCNHHHNSDHNNLNTTTTPRTQQQWLQ